MEKHPTLAAGLVHLLAGLVFVTGTMAFIMVPYALAAHPGEASPQLATTAAHHLS